MDEMWLLAALGSFPLNTPVHALIRIFYSQPKASVVTDVLHSIQMSWTSPQVLFRVLQ